MFMGSQYSSPCLIISEWIRVMREGSSRWSVSDLIREKKRGFKNRSWDDKVTAFARRRSEVHESVVSFRFGRICSCYFAVTQSSTPSRAESKACSAGLAFFLLFFFFSFLSSFSSHLPLWTLQSHCLCHSFCVGTWKAILEKWLIFISRLFLLLRLLIRSCSFM